MKRYFSTDDDGMAEFHDTAEEAKQRAADALEWTSQGDIDEDAIAQICWGEVKGAPVETERQSLERATASEEPDDQAAADLMRRNGWDFIVKYRLEDVEPPRPSPYPSVDASSLMAGCCRVR